MCTICFVYFIHQSTSRKRYTILQEKHNLKKIKQLCGLNGQHMAVQLTCSQNVTEHYVPDIASYVALK